MPPTENNKRQAYVPKRRALSIELEKRKMSFAKNLNNISLYMMAIVFLMNAVLSVIQARQKDTHARTLKLLMAGNWGLFGISYLILVARLYIHFEQAALHITLYRILLICDVLALGCIFLYIYLKYAHKLPEFSFFLKIFGVLQAIGLTILVIFDPGFSVKQTDLYVEIVPSFSCQTGVSLSMVVLILCLLTTAGLLERKNKNNAAQDKSEKSAERKDVLLLALFVFLMIVHIPLPLIVGYELLGSLVIFIFRVFICATIVVHTVVTE